jgi:hypothetical protein
MNEEHRIIARIPEGSMGEKSKEKTERNEEAPGTGQGGGLNHRTAWVPGCQLPIFATSVEIPASAT